MLGLAVPSLRPELSRVVLIALLAAAGGVYLVAALGSAWPSGEALLDAAAHPLGRDFVAFWSGAKLALGGAADAAYDIDRIHAVQLAAIGAPIKPTAWHYPPVYFLLVLPLAPLPYPVALALWLALSLAAFLLVARRLYPPGSVWLVALFPATTLCLISGQNGFVTAALLGAGLLALDRRPVLAGVCFGLLSYKPHLAMLVAPALAVGGYWRSLGVFAGTAATLVAASVVAFGVAPWHAFLGNLGFVTQLMDTGALPWARMPTVYAALRQVGVEAGPARLVQGIVGLAALVAVCGLWLRRAPFGLRASALAAAVPLATPYAFDYDLVVLALAVGWLARAGLAEGWRPGEIAVLSLAWLAPAAFWIVAHVGGPPLMPIVLIALLAAIWQRARAAPAALRPA